MCWVILGYYRKKFHVHHLCEFKGEPLSPKHDPNLLSLNHKPTAFSNNNPGHADHAQVSKAQLFGE